MAIQKARAVWESNLKEGKGIMSLGDNGPELPFSFGSRFAEGSGSNPEELIGGAHAGCFSMALAKELEAAGHPPVRIETTALVYLEKTSDGFAIPRIDLGTEAEVPGMDEETFQQCANSAKQGCVISKVLAAAEITLDAKLFSGQRA